MCASITMLMRRLTKRPSGRSAPSPTSRSANSFWTGIWSRNGPRLEPAGLGPGAELPAPAARRRELQSVILRPEPAAGVIGLQVDHSELVIDDTLLRIPGPVRRTHPEAPDRRVMDFRQTAPRFQNVDLPVV